MLLIVIMIIERLTRRIIIIIVPISIIRKELPAGAIIPILHQPF